jgi:hypothetical protein
VVDLAVVLEAVLADQHDHVRAPEASDQPCARERQPWISAGRDTRLDGTALVGFLLQEVLRRPDAQVGIVGDLEGATVLPQLEMECSPLR